MEAERIVLVGAGDHGRGVLEIVRRLSRAGDGRYTVAGFVDDSGAVADVDGVKVLGTTAWLEENLVSLGASVLLAIADPGAKQALAARLDGAGARYATLVHPSAEVSPSVRLGPGVIVNAGAAIVYEADIGAHVTVNLNATVGHHVAVGEFATIAPGANILGKAAVGARAQIHANAVVLPRVTVGEGAVVGAGSVVLHDVADGVTVFGNPARPVPVAG